VNELKPYYSEFVRHCLRYYAKTLDEGRGGHPSFRNEAERDNWSACYHALKNLSERDMDMVLTLYRPGDTIADKIYELSKNTGVSQDTLWSLVNRVEREVAKKRGLI
jgi:hypothetical protein